MKVKCNFIPYNSKNFARMMGLIEESERFDHAGWFIEPVNMLSLLHQEDHIPKSRRLMQAWVEDKLVGFFRLSSEKISNFFIVTVYGTVHPEYRHMGIGQELIIQARQTVRDLAPPGCRVFLRLPARKSVNGIYSFCEKMGMNMVRQFSVLRLENDVDMLPVEMPQGYRIRSFDVEKDLEAYFAVFHDVFKDRKLCLETLACELELPYFEPENWLMAIDGNDKIIGFCITTLDYGLDEKIGLIEYLGVIPTLQGKGLGRMLLYQGVNRLRTLDIDWVKLATEVSNDKALQLYYQTGFESWRESRLYELEII